jgi:hypothetical protein
MATAPKFRIDVDIHNLLMDSSRQVAKPAAAKGLTLPEPVFPIPSQILKKRESDAENVRKISFVVDFHQAQTTNT